MTTRACPAPSTWDFSDRSSVWCVIGAGPAGLSVAKNLKDAGLDFEVVERHEELGGIWRYGRPGSSVYHSTRMISSRRLSEFRGFAMLPGPQDYLGHEEALAYLNAYAKHHGLLERIMYGRSVVKVEQEGDGWTVHFADGARHRYRGVVVATGHHWDPRVPAHPGHFTGTTLHSSAYRTPEILLSKRVLVVGAGNSGADIAVEAARVATRTLHSVRNGGHYLPKYFAGRPMDEILEWFVAWGAPSWVHRLVRRVAIWTVFGDPARFGLPRPTHRIMDGRLILNSELVHQVAQGAIVPKPDVVELLGDRVRFSDGTVEEVDVIVHATGFHAGIPFLSDSDLRSPGGADSAPLDFALHVFHPRHDDLFVVGMIQPDSGAWWLFDDQAAMVAGFIRAAETGTEGRHAARRTVDRWSRRSYQPAGISGSGKSLRVDHQRYAALLRRVRRDLKRINDTEDM